MPDSTTLPEVIYGFDVQGDRSWEVARVHLTESLSDGYEATLELAHAQGTDPRAMLGERCVFTVDRDGRVERLCGIICAVHDRGFFARRRVADVRVVPALWLLGQRSNYRIYQDLNAVEVVERVLADAGLYQGEALRKRLGDLTLPAREYCTQYGETDLAFIRRLLEEEGIAWGFAHDGGTEALVLTNGGQRDIFTALDTGGAVVVMGEGGGTAARETLRALDRVDALTATGVRLRDYDFTHPTAIIDQTRNTPDDVGTRTLMEYPARVTLGAYNSGSHVYGESDVRRLAQTREQETIGPGVAFTGRGNVTAVRPGHVLEVQREDSDAPTRLLVTRVTHVGEAPEVLHLDAAAGASKDDRYQNSFEASVAGLPWRPSRVTPKPRAMTPQSAVVVPEPKDSADVICTDAYGRVKVRFQWDRPPERTGSQTSKNASCWVRTTQTWAGNAWGFVFLPRVGMEVLVQFLDADPDRPVVTGCLYNATHATPEKLPDTKTKSILRTQSTPDAGYNELSFEDESGKEMVHLRAQKDYSELVLNDHTAEYKHDETGKIGNDQTWEVGHDRKVTVRNDDTLTVEKNRSASITENDTLEVTKNLSITVFEASTFTVTKTHDMAIDEGMTVKVGGNSGTKLEMKPQSIKLSYSSCSIEMTGTAITLTAGGAQVKLDSTAGVKASYTTQQMELAAAGATLKGTMATVEGQGMATLKSSGTTDVKGSMTSVSGSLVKIG